ncbi:MAG: S-layer homology domain-containing protein [Clostridiales bacterium]|nr:S-layer homology domain-containing protein [Clostridiales bacterium]
MRYTYLAYSDDDGDHWIYSPFSNVASVGVSAFYKNASDWAKPELQKAYDLGLIPDILKGADMTKPTTREEFCELAVLLYEKVTGKKSEPVSPNPFTDTNNPQILKAYSLRIVDGTTKTSFSPNLLINREQCATMLFRAIKAIHPTGDYSVADVKDFPDQKDISDWAAEAAKYMYKLGILTGDAKGNFMPKATTPAQEAAGYGMAAREQAVALSLRTHDKAPEIISTSAPELDLLMGKAMSIDTGYFEAVSDVSGHTTVTKYWKKGSLVKQVVTGNDETKIDIFDMSKGEAYSYFEGSTEAVKTVYAVKDPSQYINPFNIIGPYNQGSAEESAEINITGTETIDGLSCSVITVTVNGEVFARIWVSEDGLKRRSETIYFGLPTTTLYQNYVIGGTTSDSEFELPPGMTIDENLTVTITE